MRSSLLGLAIVGVLSSSALAQATLTVPGAFPTIQAAVDAAATGDTILVSPGTYHETVDFGVKVLDLVSTDGPEATILDAQFAGRVLRVPFASRVEGFTIRRGRAPNGTTAGQDGESGGGISITVGCLFFCPPPPSFVSVIRRCIIENNRAGDGGPITSSGLQAGSGGHGGGISVEGTAGSTSVVLIESCIIRDNRAGTRGASCCSTDGHGGGVAFGGSGALPLASGTLQIRNSLVTDNRTNLANSTPQTQGFGGGIWTAVNSATQVILEGTTIAGNEAPQYGALATFGATPPPVTLSNTIIASNDLPQILAPNGTYSHCATFPESVPGAGNLNVAPGFVDVASLDFRLAADSPCRDTGATGVAMPGDVDFEGEPRVLGPQVDIGGDEFCALGSQDDFALLSVVNGGGDPAGCLKSAQGGDLLTLTYLSPAGTLDFAPAFLAAQIFPDALAPPSLAAYPFVHLDPAQAFIIDGPIFLPPGGFSQSAVFPGGLGAFSVRVQGYVVSPLTENSIFGGSDAHTFDLF